MNNDKLKSEFIKFALKALNKNQIPDYLESPKLIIVSKNGSEEGSLDNVRPIMILSHITKILEKTIKNKLEQNLSNLIHTGEY